PTRGGSNTTTAFDNGILASQGFTSEHTNSKLTKSWVLRLASRILLGLTSTPITFFLGSASAIGILKLPLPQYKSQMLLEEKSEQNSTTLAISFLLQSSLFCENPNSSPCAMFSDM